MGVGSSRRASVGGGTIFGILGQQVQDQIGIQRRGEQFGREAFLVLFRAEQGAQGRAANACVDKLAAAEPLRIGPAAWHGPAILQRREIGGR